MVDSILILLVCMFVIVGSTYFLAWKLFPFSWRDVIAFTIFYITFICIFTMLIAGFSGLLSTIPVAVIALIASAITLIIARKATPIYGHIPARPSAPSRRYRVGTALLYTVATLAGILTLRYYIIENTRNMIANPDLIWQYIPNLINFIQAHSVWNFDAVISFFPFNYELFWGWGVLFTHNFWLVAVFHLIPIIGIFFYSCAMLDILLQKQSLPVRHIGSLILVVILFVVSPVRELIYEVGKNDALQTMLFVVAIYYLLHYWTSTDKDTRTIVLAGIAIGLLIGTKVSALYWIPVLVLIHLVLLLKGQAKDRSATLRIIRHSFYLGIPAIVLAGPWIIRLLFAREAILRHQVLFSEVSTDTILHLYQHPVIIYATFEWIVPFATALLGFIGVFSKNRPVQRIGLLLFLAGAAYIYMVADFRNLLTGPYYLALCLLLVVIFRKFRTPKFFPFAVWITSLIALLILLIFATMPSSAALAYIWRLHIMHRYVAIGYILLALVLLAVIVNQQFLQHATTDTEQAALPINHHPRRWFLLSSILVMLLPAVIVVRLTILNPGLTGWEPYNNLFGIFKQPTQVFEWADQNLKYTSVYVLNLAPPAFYGKDFTNRVKTPIFYDLSVWNLDEVPAILKIERIEYFALGFPLGIYSPFQGLSKDQATFDHIERFRNLYKVVYEDEQAIVFRVNP